MSLDQLDEIGFGDNDEGVGDKQESYKGKKGEVHRISIALWHGHADEEFGVDNLNQKTARFFKCKRVYLEGVGYVIVTSPEITKIAGKDPREAVGTIVIQWPTNPDGSISKERLAKGNIRVLPWVFSGERYKALRTMHEIAGHHLGKHDILVSMNSNKDEKYQDLTLNACGDSLLRTILGKEKDHKLRKKIVDKIREVYSAEMERALGRNMTPAELREKMGDGDGGGGPVDGAGVASGEDVDSMLDGMDL